MSTRVRATGPNVWRPSPWVRVADVVVVLALVVGTAWLIFGGAALSRRDIVEFSVGDLVALALLPVVPMRWRLVLEPDELLFVFVRVRRLAVRDIVAAKTVAGEGLVFVCADGSEESFQGIGNSWRGHRRRKPTRADLVARAVLCAAAEARGEVPPVDYRLGPMTGIKRAAIKGGVVAFVVGLFVGN